MIDWDQLDNGLLGITVEGLAKFRITDCWQGGSGVLEATVTFSEQDRLGKEAIPLDERMPHWWVCFRVWRSTH